MNSDDARQRAEKNFKRDERDRDARKPMTDYEIRVLTIREKPNA
jgi:hypothetical protein